MPLEIIRNDITKVRADAIVNTANPKVAVGAGVDHAVYMAAGWDELLAERAKIGHLAPGECAATPAFALPAKYIIHTVGPAWEGGGNGEAGIVAKCYRGSLELAKKLGCETVAFPLISAGTYGFPKAVALKTAVSEITGFLMENEMTVFLVVYDKEAFEVSGKAFSEIRSFIEEEDIVVPDRSSYERRRLEMESLRLEQMMRADRVPDSAPVNAPEYRASGAPAKAAPLPKKKAGILGSIFPSRAERPRKDSIDDLLLAKEDTFQQRLFRSIDRKGLTDPEVYKRANIDRKHFSKIRSNVDYHPSKRTALALAVALGLNLDETRDLLLSAGMALTRSSVFDIIMVYCIEHKMQDINEINCILCDYDQPTLGV